jgi:hypothetical protein
MGMMKRRAKRVILMIADIFFYRIDGISQNEQNFAWVDEAFEPRIFRNGGR